MSLAMMDTDTPTLPDPVVSGYRNIIAVVAALTVLAAAMSALSVLIALNLRSAGISNAALGLVASAFSLGFLIGTNLSPFEIKRIGHIRSFAFFAAIAAIVALAYTLSINVLVWTGLQVFLGICCAGLLTSGESWIADAAPSDKRGAVLGFYYFISKTGAVAGPFVIAGISSLTTGFMVLAALFAASLLPVTATNRAQPSFSGAVPFGPRQIFRKAPGAVYAAFTVGIVNNAVAQLYPVYASQVMPETSTVFAAQFNAALTIGTMLALWPAGTISDRVDRRLVLCVLATTGAAASAGMVMFAGFGSAVIILGLALAFGAGSLSCYAIAVAHAADRANPEQVTSMMAGMLTIWAIGSALGPVLAGLVMTRSLGAPGLFVFSGVSLGILAVLMVTRAVRYEDTPEEDKEPFGVVTATSYAIAEVDPRGSEEEQLDLFSE
tara:strand:+ start:7132 stop:8442 length:1311 start_codon:yes stop_codon:yes gene_type:complete